jgi:hypothetical protein
MLVALTTELGIINKNFEQEKGPDATAPGL